MVLGFNHSNNVVIYTNIDSSPLMVEELYVDVVPSRDGHSQFSVFVRHTACKMAVRGADRPVFDH